MMRMIKMTRNITKFKITSDLQIKHGLASNKKRYIRTTTPGLAKVKISLYMAILNANSTRRFPPNFPFFSLACLPTCA